ncbi:MAG: hypothetical protein GC161_13655 [Planctomycetaceae bacterium]|nr:hypothetical protein [Planctomycetaceae bacterium]
MTPTPHTIDLAVDWDPEGSGPTELRTWADGEPRVGGWNFVLWHGSGSDGDEPVLAGLAARFAAAGHVVARPRLPYRERAARLGRNQPPNPLPQLLRAARATLDALARHFGPGRRPTWVVGGRSLGARVAAHLAAEAAPGCQPNPRAVLALAYPLQPPKSAKPRATPFSALRVPLLVVQGGRDPFGDAEAVASALAACAAAHRVLAQPELDHGFLAPRRAGVTLDRTLDRMAPEVLEHLGGFLGTSS